MVLSKAIKKSWKWWQKRPQGVRIIVYVILMWEIIGITYFLLKAN